MKFLYGLLIFDTITYLILEPLRLLFLIIAGSLASTTLPAQAILPLVEHKVLWADTVYREALIKKDTQQLAEAYYLYGKAYEGAGDLPMARRYFMKSLAIIEPQGPSFHLTRLYNKLAGNELTQGHYREGYHYAHLALKIARQIGSDRFISAASGYLERIHNTDWSDIGKKTGLPRPRPDSARYYRQLWLAANQRQIKDTLNRPLDSLYLLQMKMSSGIELWVKDRNVAGIAQLQEALQLARKIKRKTLEMEILLILGEIHLERKEFTLGKKYLSEGESMLETSLFANSFWLKHRIANTYKNYYTATWQWQEALHYAEKAHTFEKSNYLQDRDGAVSRLEVEYETEKKQMLLKTREEEIALKNANARTMRWFLFFLIFISLITIGISVLLYRLYRKKQRISNQNEILIREQNHRVKNNLQSISSLLSLQSQELQDSKALEVINESRQRVESMAILHRKLYKDHHPGYAFLPDFLEEIAENVLNAYGLTHIRLETEVAPLHLAAGKAVHLGLILNELITNSCKYAFPAHPEPTLRILCKSTSGQKISLRVADNGRRSYTPSAGKGFGMQLIETEVKQLYGEYDFSFDNGTVFTMTFPEKTPDPDKL